jgi:hypothetical protein
VQSPGGPFGDFVILDELRRIGGRTHVSTGVTMLSCCGVTSSSLSGVELRARVRVRVFFFLLLRDPPQ